MDYLTLSETKSRLRSKKKKEEEEDIGKYMGSSGKSIGSFWMVFSDCNHQSKETNGDIIIAIINPVTSGDQMTPQELG